MKENKFPLFIFSIFVLLLGWIIYTRISEGYDYSLDKLKMGNWTLSGSSNELGLSTSDSNKSFKINTDTNINGNTNITGDVTITGKLKLGDYTISQRNKNLVFTKDDKDVFVLENTGAFPRIKLANHTLGSEGAASQFIIRRDDTTGVADRRLLYCGDSSVDIGC